METLPTCLWECCTIIPIYWSHQLGLTIHHKHWVKEGLIPPSPHPLIEVLQNFSPSPPCQECLVWPLKKRTIRLRFLKIWPSMDTEPPPRKLFAFSSIVWGQSAGLPLPLQARIFENALCLYCSSSQVCGHDPDVRQEQKIHLSGSQSC